MTTPTTAADALSGWQPQAPSVQLGPWLSQRLYNLQRYLIALKVNPGNATLDHVTAVLDLESKTRSGIDVRDSDQLATTGRIWSDRHHFVKGD